MAEAMRQTVAEMLKGIERCVLLLSYTWLTNFVPSVRSTYVLPRRVLDDSIWFIANKLLLFFTDLLLYILLRLLFLLSCITSSMR